MKNIKRILAILVAEVIITTISGCSGILKSNSEASEPPQALSLLLGVHMCSKELNLRSPVITDKVTNTILNYGFISIISIDGNPSVISADSYDIPEQFKNAAKTKLESDAEKKAKNLLLSLSNVEADDPEVDTFEAIRLACRSLAMAPEGSVKTLVVADTGWSTTGLMNFGNNLLEGEPDAIAEMLLEKDALPDLSGVTVYWTQMGDVATPEEKLSPAQVKKLGNIWRAVIEKAGGTFILSESLPNSGAIGGGLPEVTPISHDTEMPVEIRVDNKSQLSFDSPQFFSEEQIQFIGDSDEYMNEEEAMRSIEPVASYMKEKTDFILLLVGTTAGDEDTVYSKELSFKRAEAVKRSLIECGIDEMRIVTCGLGSADPWHIYGVGTSSTLASQNRKVVLLDATSGDAISILEKD